MAIPLPSFKLKHTTHCWIQSNARKPNYFIYFYIPFFVSLVHSGLSVRYCCCAVFILTVAALSIPICTRVCVCVCAVFRIFVAVVVNKYQLIVIWDYDAVDMAGVWLTDWQPLFLLFFRRFFPCVCFYIWKTIIVRIVFERCRRHHCCCYSTAE